MKAEYKFSGKSIAIPLLLKFGIDTLVTFCAVVIYTLIHIETFLAATREEMNTMMYTFIDGILKYVVAITIVSSLILLPILIWMFRKDTIQSNNKVKMEWKTYLGLFIVGVTVSIGMNSLLMLSQIANFSTAYQSVAVLFYEPTFLIQILGLGIIIPIVEEVLFRGIIFRRLRLTMNRKWAIGVSALIFGMMHGNMVQFIYAFVLGILFAYLYDWCGTIKAPIFLHIIANLVSIVMTEFELSKWMFSSFLMIGVIIVGCAFVCSLLVVLIKEQMLQKC